MSIGTNAALEFGNRVGNDVRIHTGCFLEMVTIGPWLLLLGPFLLGLCRVRWNAAGGLLLAFLAAYNGAHVVALATTRYRVPVVPVVFIVAAALVAGLRTEELHPLRGWRVALLVTLGIAAVFTLAPGVPELDVWRLVAG